MMKRLRDNLTYANVMSTLCFFMLLGGGAYAATKLPANSVGTKQIKNRAVTGAKVKKGSLVGTDINPSTLFAGGVSTSAVHAFIDPTPHVTAPVASGKSATDTAGCPEGSIAIGGGADWSLHKADGYISESYPVSTPETAPPDAWLITVVNTEASPHSFDLYAVCLKTE